MGIITHGRGRLALTATIALAALLAAASHSSRSEAQAARGAPTPLTQLRIEGPKRNIEPGTWYVTGDESIKRSRGLDCKHRDGTIEVPGATALGIAETASDASQELPPVRVRPDKFGLFVCELAGLIGRPFDHPDGFAGWLYWTDYAGGVQSAELETLSDGEEVLWVFADFDEAKPLNTRNALELTGVPAYDADGTFTVQVLSHAYDGSPAPLAGAQIKGAESFVDQGGGNYQVTVGAGRTTIYAKNKPDIASNQIEVCVRPNPANCPSEHGRSIVGSPEGDWIEDTGGWDRIRTRGGNDHVDILDGGRDEVNCGGGDDEVIVLDGDTDDQIAANCEEVILAS